MATPRELRAARREGAAAARRRQRNTNPGTIIARKATGALTGAAYGTMDRMGVPPDIMGLPWKMGVYFGAALVEAMARDRVVSAAAGGLADATAAVYLYAATSSGQIVAGAHRPLPRSPVAMPRPRRTGLVDAAGNPITSYAR